MARCTHLPPVTVALDIVAQQAQTRKAQPRMAHSEELLVAGVIALPGIKRSYHRAMCITQCQGIGTRREPATSRILTSILTLICPFQTLGRQQKAISEDF